MGKMKITRPASKMVQTYNKQTQEWEKRPKTMEDHKYFNALRKGAKIQKRVAKRELGASVVREIYGDKNPYDSRGINNYDKTLEQLGDWSIKTRRERGH